ncbi:glycosyltransferase [Rhodobacter sp.]
MAAASDQDSVTIVMATHNGAAHLAEQLDSIARQSHTAWRLFVSDDSSTDDTRAILADFARHHPVTVVDGPHRGAATNFLSAILHPDLPRGTVALADQDDIWLPGKLARGLRRMAPAEDWPVLYAAESALADARGRPFRLSSPGRARPSFAASLAQNLFGGHTTMFNAATLDLLREAGMPKGIAFHDWWIYQLVAGHGGRQVLDPSPMALYRQHSGNVIGSSGFGARLSRVLQGRWRTEMQGHAQALASVAGLLTPQAQVTLSAFLSAPPSGFARIETFRRLGLRRSSTRGDILMLRAAFAGLL